MCSSTCSNVNTQYVTQRKLRCSLQSSQSAITFLLPDEDPRGSATPAVWTDVHSCQVVMMWLTRNKLEQHRCSPLKRVLINQATHRWHYRCSHCTLHRLSICSIANVRACRIHTCAKCSASAEGASQLVAQLYSTTSARAVHHVAVQLQVRCS